MFDREGVRVLGSVKDLTHAKKLVRYTHVRFLPGFASHRKGV